MFWVSTDGGASWTWVGTTSQVGMSTMIQDGNGRFVAGTRASAVTSSDDGEAWSWIAPPHQLNLVALATDVPLSSVDGEDQASPTLAIASVWPNPCWVSLGAMNLAIRASPRSLVEVDLLDAEGRKVRRRVPEQMEGAQSVTLTWRLDRRPRRSLHDSGGRGGEREAIGSRRHLSLVPERPRGPTRAYFTIIILAVTRSAPQHTS